MNIVHNIAVHNHSSDEIRVTLFSLMEALNFKLANRKIVAQAMYRPAANSIPQLDERLMLCKFLISPNKNNWCVIYPSTGWFSELQDLSCNLSGELSCVTMVLFQDDSSGWGYELSLNGNIVDKFHADPSNSLCLNEKNEALEELQEIPKIAQPQIDPEEYVGKSSLIADLFGVDKNRVVNHLSESRRAIANFSRIDSYYEMGALLHGVLGIDEWGRLYQEVTTEQAYDDSGHHLILARKMTKIEQIWQKLPSNISPPLWLNELQ